MSITKTIFYSWQSDSNTDTNQYGIRDAIETAMSLIQKKLNNSILHKEEATSNSPGSPYIPGKIVEKISNSDIFICDLTPIGESFNEKKKKIANPNVLIELGHAVAELGWDRIILLLNTNYGKVPDDLPFDVDKHRATQFKIIDKSDKSGKTQLTNVLTDAIKLIIKSDPPKPYQRKDINPEVIKRNRDVQNLKNLFNNINVIVFDQFTEKAPAYIKYDFLHYYEGFSALFKSNTFHVHDLKVFDLVKKVYDNLEIAFSYKFQDHYSKPANSKLLKFTYPNNKKDYENAEKDYKILLENNDKLKLNFKKLIIHIKEYYLEIDTEETSKKAYSDFLSYQSVYEK